MIQNYHLYFQSLEDAKELGREELEKAVTAIIEEFEDVLLINIGNTYKLDDIKEIRLSYISEEIGTILYTISNSGIAEILYPSELELDSLLLIYDALVALQVK